MDMSFLGGPPILHTTRMHSSRMRTTAAVAVRERGSPPAPRTRPPPGPGTPPGTRLPCGQTHTCKHITLPQTSFAGGKNTQDRLDKSRSAKQKRD